jgi:hypothetical protein
MKKYFLVFVAVLIILPGCNRRNSEQAKESQKVNDQQAQYSIGQPIPTFDWSLERHLMIELYKLRNKKVSTHAVWRSDYGMIEGDCPSLGYGMPYDTSLTNPLAPSRTWWGTHIGASIDVVEQPEPNGIFASKNTAATWVMCLGEAGGIEPVYIESKVTIYPGPVNVDYQKNKVTRSGAATVMISKE